MPGVCNTPTMCHSCTVERTVERFPGSDQRYLKSELTMEVGGWVQVSLGSGWVGPGLTRKWVGGSRSHSEVGGWVQVSLGSGWVGPSLTRILVVLKILPK